MDQSLDNASASLKTQNRENLKASHGELDFISLQRMSLLQCFVMVLAVLIPFLGISLGGSREPLVLSALLVCVGLLVTIRPIQARIHRVWLILGSALLLLTLFPLIPNAPDFLKQSNLHLHRILQLDPPSTISLQPWVTLEQWMGLAACVVWFWWCVGQNFSENQRRFALQLIGAFVAILAIAALYVKLGSHKIPWWRTEWEMNYFGPFPNRNHFSALLAFGTLSLFSVTYDLYRRKKKSYILFGLAIFPVFSGILISNSRSGMVLLLVGITLWLFSGGFQRRGIKRLTLLLTLLLVLSVIFMVFGKHLLQRFTAEGNLVQTLANEKRLLVYQDSWNLLTKAPVLGVGLGNFEPTYAVSKSMEHPVYRTLHPESDWLWLAIESGIPAMLVGVSIFLLIILKSSFFSRGSSRKKSRRRIRNTSCIAVMLFVIHAVFDTPLHHFGNATLVGLLGALALPIRSSEKSLPQFSYTKSLLPILGVGIITSGACYFLNATHAIEFPSTAFYQQKLSDSVKFNAQKDFASAEKSLREALEFKPLQWDIHFRIAQTILKRKASPHEASLSFARARTLEKQHVPMCFQEGDIWLQTYPEFSLPAWRAILERSPASAPLNYTYILDRLSKFPALRKSAKNFATTPKLQLTYLLSCQEEEFRQELAEFKDSKELLSVLSSNDRYIFFEAWYQRGDRADLIQRLKDHAELKKDGWPFLCYSLAESGQYQKAYDLALDYILPPFTIASPHDLNITDSRRKYLTNPNDLIQGLAYFHALRKEGQHQQALALIIDLEKLPDRPNKILYDLANAYEKVHDYPKAYQCLMDFYQQTKASNS